MKNTKLTIIGPSSSDHNTFGSLKISPMGEDSNIFYTKQGLSTIVISDGKLKTGRPVHISELEKKLSNRGLNIFPRMCANVDGNKFYMTTKDFIKGNYISTNVIPESDGNLSNCIVRTCEGNDDREREDFALEVLTDLVNDTEYRDFINNNEWIMDNRKFYVYQDTSLKTIDLMKSTFTIDVLRYSSDSYTNIVSLVPLKNLLASEGRSAKVDIEIEYTVTTGKQINTLSHFTTFRAFTFERSIDTTEHFVANMKNLVENVGDYVQIEYSDGIIRVLPLTSDVSECIISSCIVTYGNLQE